MMDVAACLRKQSIPLQSAQLRESCARDDMKSRAAFMVQMDSPLSSSCSLTTHQQSRRQWLLVEEKMAMGLNRSCSVMTGDVEAKRSLACQTGTPSLYS